jgi:NTP pyrophosphatase (non-canonical NTP hydrolase)
VSDTERPYAIGSETWPGLSKLVEECGEVLQVAGKLMGTGGQVEHWDGTDLRERMTEELADLLAAIDFLQYMNDLDTIPDLIWCEVVGRGPRGYVHNRPDTAHLCRVDHFYGKDGATAWVIPVCGTRPGRRDTVSPWDRECRRCLRAESAARDSSDED